jgi:hypothetical protein
MFLFLSALIGVGWAAESLRERVDSVGAALSESALDDAAARLKTAIAAAPESTVVVDAQTVAELLYYQGLLPRKAGAQRASDLDAWRDALIVFPDLAWNKGLLDDSNQQRVFEALRGEVQQRGAVASQVPAQAGAATMYVDGVRHMSAQAVRSGKHLAQIACPDGPMVGTWTRFDRPMHWLKMCPDAVDIAAAAVPEAPVDEFGMDTDPRAGPPPLAVATLQPSGRKRSKWQMPLLASAGGALVVSGALYAAALGSRTQYDDLDNPDVKNQGDLDALRKRTNTQATVSVVFGTVGLGLATAAVFTGRW